MAHVADHLSVSALEQQYRSCTDVTAARHLQTIWLLAKGHEMAEVAATVSYAQRWVERLLARYNAQGPQALGDLRRRNGTSPSVLRPDLLDKLKDCLRRVRDSTAQAIRASLLAKATTAVFACARARRPRSHAPSGVALRDSGRRTERAPGIRSLRRSLFPRFLMPNSLALPPVLACRGTSPSQAARSRPRLNPSPVPIAASKAVAVQHPK